MPSVSAFPEHRLWEQLVWRHGVGRSVLTHRYRLEQRHIGAQAPAHQTRGSTRAFIYLNRFRYRLRATIPYTGGSRSYLTAYNELLLHAGRNDNAVFNQNPSSVAVGRSLGPATRFEVGYLLLVARTPGDMKVARRHVLQLGVFSSAPLRF